MTTHYSPSKDINTENSRQILLVLMSQFYFTEPSKSGDLLSKVTSMFSGPLARLNAN